MAAEQAEQAEQFWAFSLRFYDEPDVRNACLALQDEAGLNVNLLLWCCWQACQGRELTDRGICDAIGRTEEWSRTVTRPLRDLRRRVKAELGTDAAEEGRHGLYERLKTAELEAEKVEQALLCKASTAGRRFAETTMREHLAKTNLDVYMRVAAVRGEESALGRLPALLAQRLARWGEYP